MQLDHLKAMSNESKASDPLDAPTDPGPADVPMVDIVASVTPPPVKQDPYIGKTFDGRYVVDAIIGEGGMGIVYRGRHKMIDKRVAIKVLRGEMAKDAEIVDRFLQEARAASAIGNPHIVDISDFGQLPDGSTYFVMEYLDGVGLGSLLTDAQPIPVPRLVRIAKQIALGLAAAHEANIVHRDLKPDNVMLVNRGAERDFAKILDFGIAKVGGATTTKTRAGSVFGTPHYMSPEQAAGTPVDSRTDIYALGVILYEMASGKVPFDADNYMGILTQHMYKAPISIRELVPAIEVPAGLDAIVLKCLSKKPEGRYTTMLELVDDLARLENSQVPNAVHEMMARSGSLNVPADYFRTGMPEPVPAAPTSIRMRPRWPLFAAIGAVATILLIVFLVLGLGRTTTAQQSLTAPSTVPVPPPPTASAVAEPAPPAPSTFAPAAAPAPLPKKLVILSVTPADAKVTRDGQDLGSSPFGLELTADEVATLNLERPGYKSQTVEVRARDQKKHIVLKVALGPAPARAPVVVSPKPAPAPAPVQTPPPAPRPGLGDVEDPWLKKR